MPLVVGAPLAAYRPSPSTQQAEASEETSAAGCPVAAPLCSVETPATLLQPEAVARFWQPHHPPEVALSLETEAPTTLQQPVAVAGAGAVSSAAPPSPAEAEPMNQQAIAVVMAFLANLRAMAMAVLSMALLTVVYPSAPLLSQSLPKALGQALNPRSADAILRTGGSLALPQSFLRRV